MSSTALYKALIEAGTSNESATVAANDVIQVSQLPQLATKADIAATKADIAATKADIAILRSDTAAGIANLRSEIGALRSDTAADLAKLETRLLKWMVGCGFLFAGIVITGVGILMQVMLSSVIVQ